MNKRTNFGLTVSDREIKRETERGASGERERDKLKI